MIKKLLLFILVSCGALATAFATNPDEIVIEMSGPQSKARPGHNIWNQTAKELTKLFRGKNKNYVLQTVDAISAQEKQISAQAGISYLLVQYGEETRDYRKFLFQQEPPQQFVTCAANAKDVVAVFQRYGVNMGLRKGEFVKTFPTLNPPSELKDGSTLLTVYQIPTSQLPRAATQPLFAIFEQNHLVKLVNGTADFEAYQKTLQPEPATAPAEKPAVADQPAQKQNNIPRKGLVSGGTLEDRMYMPRVISGPFTPKDNTQRSATNPNSPRANTPNMLK